MRSPLHHYFKSSLILILVLFLSSCVVPSENKWVGFFNKKTIYPYKMDQFEIRYNDYWQDLSPMTYEWKKYYSGQQVKRNALYISLDETEQQKFEEKIQKALATKKSMRLEEIAFWKFFPHFIGLYDKVVKLPWNYVHEFALTSAIEYMEKLGKPYDVYLLTHGWPNHITSIKGFPWISYEDIQKLQGKVTNLKMLYMQGCYSTTMVGDWLNLGVPEVLAFEGLNRNFFFVDYFLKYYKHFQYNTAKAYETAMVKMPEEMKTDKMYQMVLDAMGMGVDEYFYYSDFPYLYQDF